MHSGPNIERDGLVFGYDTGYGIAGNSIATRFYKGANITNTSTQLLYLHIGITVVPLLGRLMIPKYLDYLVIYLFFPWKN